MALTLTIAGVNQLAFLQEGSGTLKFNTFDGTLVDPATIPALGDTVLITDPLWSGTVTGLMRRPGPRPGHDFCTVTATNADVAYASAAPFGLSDAPNGTTTFGYIDLNVRQTSDTAQQGFQADAYQNDAFTTSVVATLSGTLTYYQTGLWPAMTFLFTNADLGYSGASFTAQEVSVTWTKGVPRYALTFGDPIVTMSVWLNSQAADSILPITTDDLVNNAITSTKITDGAVTTPKVAANAITANTIAANAITASKLAAELILTSLIASGTSGRRWEADSAGVRLYDASDGLLFNAPTDGSPVYVAGQINASSLVVSGNAEFQGTGNSLTQSSNLTLQAGVQPPSAAPSLVAGWPTGISLAAPSLTSYDIGGGYYDASGGADGATACWVAVVKDNDHTLVKVYEWKVSDGSIDRITTTGLVGPTVWTVTSANGFITRLGANWYISILRNATRAFVGAARATGVLNADVFDGTVGYAITSDGTFLYELQNNAGTYRLQKHDTSGAFISSNNLTSLPTGYAGVDTLTYVAGGTPRFWIGDSAHGNILEVSTAYAVVANTDFPSAKTLGNGNGFIWDGTQFQHIEWATSGASAVSKYTSWTWTTASALYWVCYAWYDSAGTTHETDVGPRQSITMGRRKQLTIGNAAIPTGGADDPDSVRVYMLPNATDPGAGAFKLQSTDALTTRILTTYNAAGAADGAGTAFVGGVGGTIVSAGVGWKLRGNGSTQFGGASFPSGPVAGDHYYRTDDLLWFYFDGTNWLSSSLYILEFPFNPISATSTFLTYGPPQWAGSDIWLETSRAEIFIAGGGSALSGSHSWIGTVNKRVAANTQTALGTHTFNSGSSSVWRTDDIAIGALLGAGTTYYAFDVGWVKTGTPGNLQGFEILTYRLVAT